MTRTIIGIGIGYVVCAIQAGLWKGFGPAWWLWAGVVVAAGGFGLLLGGVMRGAGRADEARASQAVVPVGLPPVGLSNKAAMKMFGQGQTPADDESVRLERERLRLQMAKAADTLRARGLLRQGRGDHGGERAGLYRR